MPTPSFYGIDPGKLDVAAGLIEKIRAGGDLSAWGKLLDSLACVYEPPALGGPKGLRVVREPIIRVNAHAGLPDLSVDELPAADSPSLRWVLGKLARLTSRCVFHGGFDGFHGSLFDGLSSALPTPDDSNAAGRLGAVLGGPSRIPKQFSFLSEEDAYCQWLDSETLASLIQSEAQDGAIAGLCVDLKATGDPILAAFAGELRKIMLFLSLCEADRLSVYYCEYAT